LIMILAGILFFKKDLKYFTRALSAVIITYILGVWLMISVGFASGGPACLFAFSVLAGILLGLRAAGMALLINALTLIGAVWQIQAASSQFPVNFPRMITSGATFMFMNAMVALSVAVLLKGLQSTSRREKEALNRLKQEHQTLKDTKNRLQQEIEIRIRMEAALQKSESRFREMAELFPATLFETDLNGKLLFVNKIALSLFGYESIDFEKGLYAINMIAEEDRERATMDFQRAIQGKSMTLIEYKMIRKDGSTFPGAVQSASMIQDGKPSGLRGAVLDLSEMKHLEAQLIQAQKMEAIGTLAGGIAHDFNNLLMGILGRVSLLGMEPERSAADRETLKGIEEHVHSAANLTRRLLGFARGGKYEVKSIDLNELMDKSVDMFGRTRKEIRIHKKYEDKVWTADIDRSQI
ncbi:MAG: PAS domain S-box protein, partial [Thermodesulfobacteriota bacterium]